jgi:hypothetical protein
VVADNPVTKPNVLWLTPATCGGRVADCSLTEDWLYPGMHFQHGKRLGLLAVTAILTTSGCQPNGKESPPAKAVPTPESIDVESATKNPALVAAQFGLSPAVKSVTSDTAGEFEITYEWRVSKKREQDWRVFVHFTEADGAMVFQNDHGPELPVSQWTLGTVQQGPFTVKIPEGVEGAFDIRMGLFQSGETGLGASTRDELDGNDDGEKRYLVGHLAITAGKAEFQPAE